MNRNRLHIGLATACFAAVFAGAANAQNLVTNGSFAGGDTGFTSSYTDCNASTCNQSTGAGAYFVGTDPSASPLAYPDWESYGDHTTGSGNMFIASGGSTADGSPYAWEETINVVAGKSYNAGFFARDIDSDLDIASLQMDINGTSITTAETPSQGSWGQIAGAFTATSSGPVTVEIADLTPGFGFNDFAVDDVSVTAATVSAAPEPSTWLLMFAGIGGIGVMLRRAKKTMGFRFKDALRA